MTQEEVAQLFIDMGIPRTVRLNALDKALRHNEFNASLDNTTVSIKRVLKDAKKIEEFLNGAT